MHFVGIMDAWDRAGIQWSIEFIIQSKARPHRQAFQPVHRVCLLLSQALVLQRLHEVKRTFTKVSYGDDCIKHYHSANSSQ